jgi:transcriptional regulator with PAS, ATPase and Fis domain
MPSFQDPEIYRDILDGLQIEVSVLDLQKKIVFWSDGAEKITGYARIDVLGHSCAENILLHCNHTGCEMSAGKRPAVPSSCNTSQETLTTKMQSLRLGGKEKTSGDKSSTSPSESSPKRE